MTPLDGHTGLDEAIALFGDRLRALSEDWASPPNREIGPHPCT